MQEWRIHLGAHKTATTHIQEVLTLKRKSLVAAGTDYIPSRVVRRAGLAQALAARSVAARLPVMRERMVERIMDDHLRPLRAGPERIILSEENLIGGLESAYLQPIYPLIGSTVPRLASLGKRAKVVFFLSIRSFDAQLPSSYAQILRLRAPRAGGFEAVRRKILSTPPSWFDLVCRIRRLAPGVPLIVWRQEDYRAHSEEILETICGVPIGSVPHVEDPVSTRSPCAEAIRAAEALPANMDRAARRARVDEIYRQTAGDGPFRPFSRTETQMLRKAYEADVAQIERLSPDILVKFRATGPVRG